MLGEQVVLSQEGRDVPVSVCRNQGCLVLGILQTAPWARHGQLLLLASRLCVCWEFITASSGNLALFLGLRHETCGGGIVMPYCLDLRGDE